MFRKSFNYDKPIFWYPQHQSKALRQLKNGVHHIDLVVEVRDARIPLTSINKQFDAVLGHRERIVVYNKSDLCNNNMRKPLVDALATYRGESCIFTSATKGVHVDKILERACRDDPVRYPFLSMVVVGMPNVGKSTIINALRRMGVNKGKVTAVGKTAGVTTAIQTRVKIYHDPPIYLVDTPGIFDPNVSTPAEGLKISVCGTFFNPGSTKDKYTAVINVADYLLFRLNNSKNIDKYSQHFGLDGPTDNIGHFLEFIATKYNYRILERSRLHESTPTETFGTEEVHSYDKTLDLDRAALLFIDTFRQGKLGAMTLDDCSVDGLQNYFAPSASENASAVDAEMPEF